jgi:hypothetical protein
VATVLTIWSALVEGLLDAHRLPPDAAEPGAAEILMIEVLEDLGVNDVVAGGGLGDRLAVRFSLEGFDLVDVGAHARELFLTAADKAGLPVLPPDVLEVTPLEPLIQANVG